MTFTETVAPVIPSSPQICYMGEDDFEFLILLSHSPRQTHLHMPNFDAV